MATRSLIGFRREDGKLDVMYCHYDGGLVLGMLHKHYRDGDSARPLLELGAIRALHPTIEECKNDRLDGEDSYVSTVEEAYNRGEIDYLVFFEEGWWRSINLHSVRMFEIEKARELISRTNF